MLPYLPYAAFSCVCLLSSLLPTVAMALNPKGWLDIHGHFTLPFSSPAAAQAQVEAFHSINFLVSGPWTFSAKDTLPYLDEAQISMQMLSYISRDHATLQTANDFGANVVTQYPSRFGLLLALPTDNVSLALSEIKRGDSFAIPNDGYALPTIYNGVLLSDPSLDPVFEVLNARKAVCHVHPNAGANGTDGRPSPLIDVAFETARVAVDMMYRGVFRRYPDIIFVFAHCGGALPVLAGRLALLGAESWVPNPLNLTKAEIEKTLNSLYVDTAATAKTGMEVAVKVVGMSHVIYGDDCNVQCSTNATMLENQQDVINIENELVGETGVVASNGWALFPAAAKRAADGQEKLNSTSI